MGLELRQQLKLTQQLVMTPQLQQAIKLLQMSRIELVETVNKELLENPVIEELTEGPEVGDSLPEPVQERELPIQAVRIGDASQARNADWESYLGEFSSTARSHQFEESESPEETTSFEARLSAKPSLDAHLFWQLNLSRMTSREREIGEIIIGNLDSAGYLMTTVEEIAEVAKADPVDVERVLHLIQHFDPVGVAARTVQECLLIQIHAMGEEDPILISIVQDHLPDIEKRNFKVLLKKFQIQMEDLQAYLEIIQRLEPMPGGSLGSSDAYYISPDVYVYRYGEEFVIVLNDDGLPKLQLNPFYVDELKEKKGKDREYLQDKVRSAQWLMKSLYQRQRTLYKVAESIVRFQRLFFEQGVSGLHPLILRDVAEDIGMHESTVSRITTSKYMATPHGVFELKFFFNSSLEGDDGNQIGSESVKDAIKKIVAVEDPKKPLSDEVIVDMLKEDLHVNIARRTVAKYRAALDIPSSSRRKKFF